MLDKKIQFAHFVNFDYIENNYLKLWLVSTKKNVLFIIIHSHVLHNYSKIALFVNDKYNITIQQNSFSASSNNFWIKGF